jgi:hypothetical protein
MNRVEGAGTVSCPACHLQGDPECGERVSPHSLAGNLLLVSSSLEEGYPDWTLSATAETFPGYFIFDVESDGTPGSTLIASVYADQVWLTPGMLRSLR